MQETKVKSVAQTLRDLEVGESATWSIERNDTVRNAATRRVLMHPEIKIVCSVNRADRTITATRTA